ncbi:MAG TPA: sialate O-acetylesterase, partial [Polyangiaceae bacterium]|nr:sialate O-acetylesterase [Polyangiaceae bacterium]
MASDPNLLIFLLIGQSNMEGAPPPDLQDQVTDDRVKVLAYDNTGGRLYNEWYAACPPLHSTGLGPGDYFAKLLAARLPAQYRIGLVPCAINGVDIDFFGKGVISARRAEFPIPPDNLRSGAYDWVVERARLAQRDGVVRGILFHQGESDCGQSVWVVKVADIVEQLRADLELGSDVPFVAGELLRDGRCAAHNALVNQLPHWIPNCHIVSSARLTGMDLFHFDLASQRELGKRYAEAMLESLQLEFANRASTPVLGPAVCGTEL